MAFLGFGKKKKEDALTTQPKAGKVSREEEQQKDSGEEKKASSPEKKTPQAVLSPVADAISAPRITEKATDLTQYGNAYVFEVLAGSNKQEIAAAVEERYGVTPVKVRTLSIPHKKRFSRGKWSVVGGGKKAIVYLKKGDAIHIS